MIYLGTIVNAGTDVKNNANTATPLVIPSGTVGLRLQPDAATMLVAVKYADDSTFAPAATAALQLGAAQSFNDLPIAGAASPVRFPSVITLSVRKSDAGAGNTKVFSIAV